MKVKQRPRSKDLEHIIKTLRKHLRYLRKEYGVKSLAIFGSYARGEHKESSDVDILVEFSKPIGLKFISLADYLEKILGKRVDLLTPNALKQVPEVWKKVKEDLIPVI